MSGKVLWEKNLYGATNGTNNLLPQWGQNPQHTGFLSAPSQSLQAKLSDQIFDPFTSQEIAESDGALLMHYQVPLVNGNNVYMMFKTGTYNSCVPPGSGQPFPCGPNDWNTEIWNETDLQWQNGQLVPVWNFATDWTPLLRGADPFAGFPDSGYDEFCFCIISQYQFP